MKTANCASCPYVKPIEYEGYEHAGECHAEAPDIEPDPAYFGQARWPLILDITKEFCGEHPWLHGTDAQIAWRLKP